MEDCETRDEVLVMRVNSEGREPIPVAIAVELLGDSQIFPFDVAERSFVVITTEGGANRVYSSEGVEFDPQSDSSEIIDRSGWRWRVEEDALVAEDGSGT